MYTGMKTNAPKKIYVADATFPNYVNFDGSPINTKRIDDRDIEYIRTDTFIEKAFEFFDEYLKRTLENIWSWKYMDVKNTNCNTFINTDDKLKENFRKYMEGE